MKTFKEVGEFRLWAVCNCGVCLRWYDRWDDTPLRIKDCCRACGRMLGGAMVVTAREELEMKEPRWYPLIGEREVVSRKLIDVNKFAVAVEFAKE